MHPVHFLTSSETWGETQTHQLSLGPSFWGEKMQVYEPESFRVMLIFQSLDYASIAQNKDDMNILVLGNTEKSRWIDLTK